MTGSDKYKGISVKKRTTLKTLAGVGTGSIMLPGVAAADNRPGRGPENRPGRGPENNDRIPDEWVNKDGDLSIPESDLEDFDVIVRDRESGEKRDDLTTAVTNVDSETDSKAHSKQITTQANWSSPLYRTLYKGSAGGYSLQIRAGLRARRGTSGVEISLDFTIQIESVSFDIYSLKLRRNENDGFCVSPRAPPQFPVSFDICIDIQWAGGTAISIGGSGEACVLWRFLQGSRDLWGDRFRIPRLISPPPPSIRYVFGRMKYVS